MENCLLVLVFSLTKHSNAFCFLIPTHVRTLPSPEPSTSSSLLGALPLSGTDHMTDSTPLVIVPFPNLHTSTKMAATHKQYTSHMFSTADITSDVQGSQRTNWTSPPTEGAVPLQCRVLSLHPLASLTITGATIVMVTVTV